MSATDTCNYHDILGIQYDRPHRLDVAHCTTLPLTLVFLPAADIATYVGEGNVDLGITGIDVVRESQADHVDSILVRKLCILNHFSIHSSSRSPRT